ncbi:MAG: type IV pilus assembly protein PilM [Actinomycetota bacterium]
MSRIIGLDVGTSAVRGAQVSFVRGGATLEAFGQVPLARGAVKDGEIQDAGAVRAALGRLWKRSGFRGKQVVLGVASQRVMVRQVDLPELEDKEFRASLALQVQEYIPIPVEQAILDYQAIDRFTSESGQAMLRILLVAASKDMVGGLVDTISGAGLKPIMVDLTPFAVLRSVTGGSGLGLGGAEALIDIGGSVTNILVHAAGVPRFVRILIMGGDDITEALVRETNLGWEDAEGLKARMGLGPVEPGSPAAVVDRAVGAFVDEIRGSLDYYRAQVDSLPLSRAVVSGGGANLAGLRERLSAALRLSVEPAHPLAALKVGKLNMPAEQLPWAEPVMTVPIGLALGASR